MHPKSKAQFIQFLHDELAIPATHVQLALKHSVTTPSMLAIVLWQYGLITLAQLDQIFDWLEQKIPLNL